MGSDYYSLFRETTTTKAHYPRQSFNLNFLARLIRTDTLKIKVSARLTSSNLLIRLGVEKKRKEEKSIDKAYLSGEI